MTFGQKSFQGRPPDKGSFPLDHDGECKRFMLSYMRCLRENHSHSVQWRGESKEYPQCRMDRNLMAREPWSQLGYRERETSTTLKLLIKMVELNPENYCFHGFRGGRATSLHQMGISVETIKKLGRWKTNAVFQYLR